MDRVRYNRSDQFVYQFAVPLRPLSSQAKRKSQHLYAQRVKDAAQREVSSKILTSDIEIEITWTSTDRQGVRSDVDNIIKPILDALAGIAYDNDRQVRTVLAVYVDRSQRNTVHVHVEELKDLFFTPTANVVQVTIYSDSKLAELGGADVLSKRHLAKKLPGLC